MTKEVKTRFAVSPTGFMHVGGVRTALFSYLYAKAHHGRFILRIEDTDKSREVDGAVEHIMEALEWLGLRWDEGPKVGGSHGSYVQSERLDFYREKVQEMLDNGLAYVDPFTPEQVNEFRDQAKAEKRPFLFREHRPEDADLPAHDDWYGKKPIRFKTTDVKRYEWHDVVRGDLSAGEEALDDFVIMKADGYPTYNFAHVVDDQDMEVTHIIRGEEFISSVPKYLSLMDALGIEWPVFITAPPILNMNGGKKLSKRDGAKDALTYREEGYSPAAIINFLVSMGWNDGSEREIFSLEELEVAFDADRIQKSGAKFDETKLDWIAWQHSAAEIADDPTGFLARQGIPQEQQSAEFAQLAASKARSTEDFLHQYSIYTDSPTINLAEFDLKQVDNKLDSDTAFNYIRSTITVLEELEDFSSQAVETALRAKMEELEAAPRAYLNLIRWAITNSKVSPNLFEMISLIGKEEIVYRLNKAL